MVSRSDFTGHVIFSIKKILGLSIEMNIDHGSLTDEEVTLISDSLAPFKTADKIFMEIGSLFGFNIINQLQTYPKMKAVIVENYNWNPYGLTDKQHELILHYMLRYFKVDKQVLIFNSLELVSKMITPNFIFIDSSHELSETKKEILWSLQQKPLILMGDDYKKWQGVTKAVDELISPLTYNGKIWIYKP